MAWRKVVSLCFAVISCFIHVKAGFAIDPPAASGPIQDNSFLIEEAYNQEAGVVQHISTMARLWGSKDWGYSFTEEWPAGRAWRHQFSYTLGMQHAGDFPGSGAGLGDVLLNYPYQLFGSGETRVAFSPRWTLLFAAGDAKQGRSIGGTGLQTNLPLSVSILPKLVTHFNAGAMFVPHAQNERGEHAFVSGYNVGQSVVWLVRPRVNLLLEAVYTDTQEVTYSQRTAWSPSLYVSPGVRWSHNFRNGLQIVPGVGVPIGVGVSRGETGLFLYLSFEHPFGGLRKR